MTAQQLREADQFTIKHEPIAAIDLMERASKTFVEWFVHTFRPARQIIVVFCGPGNNGGDGLAIARLLADYTYAIQVFHALPDKGTSPDFTSNLKRLQTETSIPCQSIDADFTWEHLPEDASICIDALFGSGLNRPLEGHWQAIVKNLNELEWTRVAVDIPSGMFADRHTNGMSIMAHYTLSFACPKLGFLLAENAGRVGKWEVKPIGLQQTYLRNVNNGLHLVSLSQIQHLLKPRRRHSHKGTFGHALLMVGSYGKMGAAILAGMGCLRSGTGLLSYFTPKCGYHILQTTVPEAMVLVDPTEDHLSMAPDLSPYRAIGVGCGIGQHSHTEKMLEELMKITNEPMVIDADALNIIAKKPELMSAIPEGSILTPHPKEFSRLFGQYANEFDRLEGLRRHAANLGVIIVLKGAHTAIATPDGQVFFNSSGNPGMATGGSGDVLTGILTGLLAQGYSPRSGALLGVYWHGLAGDLAAQEWSQPSMIAGDIPKYLGQAWKLLENSIHEPNH